MTSVSDEPWKMAPSFSSALRSWMEGHGAPAVPDDHGLGVGPHPAAGGGVADMAGGHVSLGLAHIGHHLRGKDFVHQTEVPVAGDDAVLVDGHAAALLAAVLQSVQGGIDRHGHILGAGLIVDTKNAALLVKRVGKIRHACSFVSLASCLFCGPPFTGRRAPAGAFPPWRRSRGPSWPAPLPGGRPAPRPRGPGSGRPARRRSSRRRPWRRPSWGCR